MPSATRPPIEMRIAVTAIIHTNDFKVPRLQKVGFFCS